MNSLSPLRKYIRAGKMRETKSKKAGHCYLLWNDQKSNDLKKHQKIVTHTNKQHLNLQPFLFPTSTLIKHSYSENQALASNPSQKLEGHLWWVHPQYALSVPLHADRSFHHTLTTGMWGQMHVFPNYLISRRCQIVPGVKTVHRLDTGTTVMISWQTFQWLFFLFSSVTPCQLTTACS